MCKWKAVELTSQWYDMREPRLTVAGLKDWRGTQSKECGLTLQAGKSRVWGSPPEPPEGT